MKDFKSKCISAFYAVIAFVSGHKVISSISVLLVAAIITTVICLPNAADTTAKIEASSNVSSVTNEIVSSEVDSAISEISSANKDLTSIVDSDKDNESKEETVSSEVASTNSEDKDESSSEGSNVGTESSDETTSSKADDNELNSSKTSSKDTSSKKPSKEKEDKKENTSSKTSSKDTSSKKPSKEKEDKKETTPNKKTPANNIYANMTPDDNVFLDALEYTGYQLDVQRKSGKMWGSFDNYILCSQKKGLGWLSDITYDDYGRASGYETNKKGKPDISYFEDTGLVCASYVTYVYFNYLPNVAGIDTSKLAKPKRSITANDWYIAGKKWIDKGYSRYIDFTANDGGSINNDIKFTADEDIPIGSLIVLCDWYNRSDWCSHICIYAGKKNGYHWVTHVGNENGPEFCAIERMNRKPHPQWPIAVITPPSNLKFSTKD